MWNFKPLEKNPFFINNKDVIINNSKYIKEYQLIEPSYINELYDNITYKFSLFPKLQKLYNMIPNWISKTDLGRLLIVYYNSGIYCDVDCSIKKNFEKYDKDYNVILYYIIQILNNCHISYILRMNKLYVEVAMFHCFSPRTNVSCLSDQK